MLSQHERYRRWYLKLKADPVRYKARLKSGKIWNTKYRQEYSTKYQMVVERRRIKRNENPFPHREEVRAYYNEVKKDPVSYYAMLKKKSIRHGVFVQGLKDHGKYRSWLDNRNGYKRYYRIIKKAAESA